MTIATLLCRLSNNDDARYNKIQHRYKYFKVFRFIPGLSLFFLRFRINEWWLKTGPAFNATNGLFDDLQPTHDFVDFVPSARSLRLYFAKE